MDTQTSPRVCIGLLGQHSSGKSTLLNSLLDNKHSEDMKGTHSLVCANAVIYKCNSGDAACYRSCSSSLDMEEQSCGSPGHEENQMSVSKHFDVLDCPGNMNYMSTMLDGIMMADAVLLMSTPSESFSLGPTAAILAASNAMGKRIVILLNDKEKGTSKIKEHLKNIRKFTNLIISRDVPVIKLCAKEKDNIEALYSQIINMSAPQRDIGSPALMTISGSFIPEDVGDGDDATISVIMHGRIMQGAISSNQEVEVRPGIIMQGDNGNPICCPILLKIEQVNSKFENTAMAGQLATLTATPTITNGGQLIKSVLRGGLSGQLLGYPGSLPAVYSTLKIKVSLLPRMFNPFTEEVEKGKKIERGDDLLLTTGVTSSIGTVHSINGDTVVISGLSPPICARQGERLLVSGKQVLLWYLIGHGEILQGKSVKVAEPTILTD